MKRILVVIMMFVLCSTANADTNINKNELAEAESHANAYLKNMSIDLVNMNKGNYRKFEQDILDFFKIGKDKGALWRCEGFVHARNLEFQCQSGTGKFPVPDSQIFMQLANWKVTGCEYTFAIPPNINVKGIGSVDRNKVTDNTGDVNVTFQFDLDRIHVTQTTYPAAYNMLLAGRQGSLSINSFYKMVDSLWVKYMLVESRLYKEDMGEYPNPYYLMNAFVSMLAREPGNVIDLMTKAGK